MKISPIGNSLFVRNEKTGEEFKLGIITEVTESVTDPQEPWLWNPTNMKSLTYFTGTFAVTNGSLINPKVRMELYGITNNYIRMHGGKPMRTVPRRFSR